MCGLVLARQRPGTAKGVVFATLEDETGVANIVIWRRVFERYRNAALDAGLLAARGVVQREGIVVHLVAGRLVDLTPMLAGLAERDGAGRGAFPVRSRDFR